MASAGAPLAFAGLDLLLKDKQNYRPPPRRRLQRAERHRTVESAIRRMQKSAFVWAAGALSARLVLGAAAASAQAVSPPVQLPAATCSALQLTASHVMSEGAAGTIFDTLQLTNIGDVPCTLDGFVTVQMLDAANNPLPTVTVPGGGMLSGRPDPSAFTLPSGASSQWVQAWSDVPHGGETTCPMAATVEVTPPDTTTPIVVAGLSGIAPCNSGTIDVSPLRAPGVPVP